MIFQNWIEGVALVFGETTTNTAIIMSLIIIVLMDILVIMNMKEQSMDALFFVDTGLCVLFTFMRWLPVFTGSVLALIFALIGAQIVRDRIMGR